MLISESSAPSFVSAGDVTLTEVTFLDETNIALGDSNTAGFGTGDLDGQAGFSLDLSLDAGPMKSATAGSIVLTDVDGDIIELILGPSINGFLSTEFEVSSVSYSSNGDGIGDGTFDGADGGSFDADGLSLFLEQGAATAGVTLLPGIDAPLAAPFLVQGFVLVQIPSPGSFVLAGSGCVLAFGRRRRA